MLNRGLIQFLSALFGKNGQKSGEDPEECETELSSDCDSSRKN